MTPKVVKIWYSDRNNYWDPSENMWEMCFGLKNTPYTQHFIICYMKHHIHDTHSETW